MDKPGVFSLLCAKKSIVFYWFEWAFIFLRAQTEESFFYKIRNWI